MSLSGFPPKPMKYHSSSITTWLKYSAANSTTSWFPSYHHAWPICRQLDIEKPLIWRCDEAKSHPKCCGSYPLRKWSETNRIWNWPMGWLSCCLNLRIACTQWNTPPIRYLSSKRIVEWTKGSMTYVQQHNSTHPFFNLTDLLADANAFLDKVFS